MKNIKIYLFIYLNLNVMIQPRLLILFSLLENKNFIKCKKKKRKISFKF